MKILLLILSLLTACGLDYGQTQQTLGAGMTRTTIVSHSVCKGADGLDMDAAGNIVIPCEQHSSTTPSAVIAWNNGDGTYTLQYLPGNLVGPEEAKWFDEDGDGDLDVLITQATKVSLYRRNGVVFTLEHLWVRPVDKLDRYNSVVPMGVGRFVLGSYSTDASIYDCAATSGVYSCAQLVALGSNGWPKRMHKVDSDVLVWNNAGPYAGVFYAFSGARLTTTVGTQGGSESGGRIVTGHDGTLEIIGETTITLPADFANYRDAAWGDFDSDGEEDLFVTGINSTNLDSSAILLPGPDFSTFLEVAGWEGIKHDNGLILPAALFTTEEKSLGLVKYTE